MSNKERSFEELVQEVQGCKQCPRMDGRKRVFSAKNGNPYAKVLFIAEAPSRLGAGRTGIPLCGEVAGKNFEKFLCNIGWVKTPLGDNRTSWAGENIFVTNAVLCNPLKEDGTIDEPSDDEMKNCSKYLQETISIVNPEVIVTLGKQALKALNRILPHDVQLARDLDDNQFKRYIAEYRDWGGKIVFPLCYPGLRVINSGYRTEDEQESDYKKLQALVDPIKGLKK